jgi:hypothetical protein
LAERWKMVSLAAFLATVGMNWIALAPFPITATFLPVRSCAWFQRAEWNDTPSKSARPGSSGTCGRFSWPTPETSTFALTSSPAFVRMRHCPFCSSKLALVTSVPKRMCGRSWYFSAQCCR